MEYKVHDVQWTDEKVKRFWDFYNNYAAFDNLWFSKAVGRGVIGFVEKFFPIRGKVLDYGIGKGHFTSYLLEKSGLEVTACDFSGETVNNINDQFKNNSNFKGCFLVQGFPSSFADNEFDVVFLIEAIEHLTDDYLLPTIDEARRILKLGGRFVVTTPNDENLKEQNIICPDCGGVFHRVQHVRAFNRHSLKALMDSHGFKTRYCNATDFYQFGNKSLLYKIRNSIFKVFKSSYQPPHLIYIGEKN